MAETSPQSDYLRIAGVPEHFSVPIQMAIENGLDAKFVTVSTGTGGMLALLDEGQVDVIVALTEGLVMGLEKGRDLAILGTYVSSKLRWAIVCGPNTKDDAAVDQLDGATFGISRPGSGSELMAHVLARERSWQKPLKFVECRNLPGLVGAVTEGRADAFLWEHFTTKPHQDRGEVRFIGDIPTPWGCFLFATKREFARSNKERLHRTIASIRQQCEVFMGDRTASASRLNAMFGIQESDAHAWLSSVQFRATPAVARSDLQSALSAIQACGLTGDSRFGSVVDYVAEGTTLE
eukprot:TRINITY_DN9486_c0_g1_i1.p2 TRINITY_DN9486_c0_g1~~TRINITY_DN9486_c0_g1_i1.p2  ORF type:complete len:293 (+),score=49.20 TRINITY_DN9486_c0_g1_i1:39-917(+)